MTEQRTAGARAWLEEVLGADGAVPQASAWNQFAAGDRPVVTLFGAYDTGKSALVRRLLVKAGLEVPDWDINSARHETFVVGAADFRGVSLRDTPVWRPAPSTHPVSPTVDALQAPALSEVGRRDKPDTADRRAGLINMLLGDRWPPGSILLVISKFDSTGVSPEYDLDGHHELRPQGHRTAEFTLARRGRAGAGRFPRRRGRRRRPAAAGPVHLGPGPTVGRDGAGHGYSFGRRRRPVRPASGRGGALLDRRRPTCPDRGRG